MQHFRTEREIESGIELEQQQDFLKREINYRGRSVVGTAS